MLQAIGFALKYLPIIVAAVQFVQNFARPDASKEARQALAVRFVQDTLEGFGVRVNDRTREIIGGLVNLAVVVMNAFGIFTSKKGPAPEAIEVAAPVAAETRISSASDADLDALEAILTR